MGLEIERKFLVEHDSQGWRVDGIPLRQGYLSRDKERTVRVRVAGERGMLTVKGLSEGPSRAEFEYDIPLSDATTLLDDLCLKPLIEKVRYRLPAGPHLWEIDVFGGDNLGLIVAEIELTAADEEFVRPRWLGEEVTDDSRYFNSSLIGNPYCRWGSEA